MAERLNLSVDDGVSDLLTELAGGERKRGQWLSDLVRGQYNQMANVTGSDFETLRLSHAGLVGQVRQTEGRLLVMENRMRAMEQQLAALMAEKADVR
jgi:hypothetical protein